MITISDFIYDLIIEISVLHTHRPATGDTRTLRRSLTLDSNVYIMIYNFFFKYLIHTLRLRGCNMEYPRV